MLKFWYRTSTEQGRQRQIRLVKASKTKEGKKLAGQKLLEELFSRDAADDTGGPSWITVGHVLRGFLKSSEREHDKDTAAWYRALLGSFEQRYGKLRYLTLKKKHVLAWLRKTGYNPTSQNKAVGALKRAFNWAVEAEHIAKTPSPTSASPGPSSATAPSNPPSGT